MLSPVHFLLCLRSAVQANETQLVEVSKDDFLEFENMSRGAERIKEALGKDEEE